MTTGAGDEPNREWARARTRIRLVDGVGAGVERREAQVFFGCGVEGGPGGPRYSRPGGYSFLRRVGRFEAGKTGNMGDGRGMA